MNISIKATHTSLSESMKESVEQKMGQLEVFLRPEDKVHVELAVDPRHRAGPVNRAEISIKPHGIFAQAYSDDVYSALDMVIPKVREQLVKLKDKKLSERRS